MATPLTLYIAIRQDPTAQATGKKIYESFAQDVKRELDNSQIVHYARVALVPNTAGGGYAGFLLITSFDGPMNPYLKFFWDSGGIQELVTVIAGIAVNPPDPPITDLTSFENFINNNNINSPEDLYQAYPQTVRQIIAAFPPT